MKKIISIMLVFVTILALASCAKAQKPDWQTSLDLGQKYLLDGNYEQAIIEFNKVIEIDPKNVEAYIGLAEVYAAQGDYESAISVLEQGYAETDNQSLQDKINELRGLAASQTEAVATADVTTLPETTATPETVAETAVESERVKVFWMGPGYEQYTYDEYGRCVAYLSGEAYSSTLNYQIIFSYDENGKVEKAVYYPLGIYGFFGGIFEIVTGNLYYNEQGNLILEFKDEQEDTQIGFASSRQVSFEFSDRMWLMCINYNSTITGESSFYADTTESHYERDASGKIFSVDYYNGHRFEEYLEVFSHYEITYDDSDLPASWAYYIKDNKVLEGLYSFEEGLLKSVISYNYQYSLNSENMPYTTVVTYNENKKPVKITTTSPVYGAGSDGSFVQLPRTVEFENNYEYDSEGKLSKITSTSSDSLGYEIFEYEHTPYLSLKNVILPDYNTYEDTQQDGMIRVGYTAIDGHWYINHVEIDKEFFIPTDSAEDFHGLYIDGELLTETLDYSLPLGAGRTIWINGSAFEKIDVFENEGVHTIVTEFRNESGELLYRKALNIHLDLERLRN